MTPFVQDADFTKLCECGCGQPAPIAAYSHAPREWVKGQPKRFVSGHNGRQGVRARLRYVEVDSGFETPCWLWLGGVDANGYGRIAVDGVPLLAHRVMYEIATGDLPLVLHHRCTVHGCINPEHLQATTHGEHQRIEQAYRTHCRRGHAYAEHGRFHKSGARYCRRCERDNERRRVAAPRG